MKKLVILLTTVVISSACARTQGSKSANSFLKDESTQQDVLKNLEELKTPKTTVIIAANAGAVVGSTNGGVNYFYGEEIKALEVAATKLNIPVCSIAPQGLSVPTSQGQSPGKNINDIDVVADCLQPKILKNLRQLKTPNTTVIIAANAGAVVGSTNGGVNYFYGEEIKALEVTAVKLNIPVCSIASQRLSVPTLEGQSPGKNINDIDIVADCLNK